MHIIRLAKAKLGNYLKYRQRLKFIRTEMKAEKDFVPFELAPEYQKCLNSLTEDGFGFIDGFEKMADYINESYFKKMEAGDLSDSRIMKNMFKPSDLNMGRKISVAVSLKDDILRDLYFDENLIKIFYNYYQRQPYYRNYPWLVMHQNNETDPKWVENTEFQGKYHLDQGKHQLSYMLLINDLGENDTRLQFAKKSHKKIHYSMDRNTFKDSDIEEQFEIVDCIGPKGRLYIFDAGNGFHRAKYMAGSTRKILHANITTGHSIVKDFLEDFSNTEWLSEKSPILKNMVAKISK